MKDELMQNPAKVTLDKINQYFSTDETAREYLESLLWPNGVTCPHCKNNDEKTIWKIKANKEKKIREGLRRCAKCNKEFTCTVGTIFEDSHIPLRKWLVAWYMVATAKKGISALWIQQNLGLGSYRTAWMMMHKIRHALKDPAVSELMTGTLEVDETYVNALPRKSENQERPVKGFRQGSEKVPVVALINRSGEVRAKVMPTVSQKNLRLFVGINADPNSIVNTDCSSLYWPVLRGFKRHDRVNHKAKEYARHNRSKIPHTHFSILNEMIFGMVGQMEKDGYTLPDKMIPDISMGLMFCKWLRTAKGIDTKNLPTYKHKYQDGRIVDAKLYPNSVLADFRAHFHDEWLPKRAIEYFRVRDSKALPYLQKLLPTTKFKQLTD